MRNPIIFLIVWIVWSFMHSTASSQTITVSGTFPTVTAFSPFSGFSTVYSLKVSGSVELNSASGLVRLVLVDKEGNRRLLFEPTR